ncbi:helix-turn-helix domain-containing protein [Streptomyces mirabilis]|uniref:helix-turn-helix domain-containing protein n=1 Tax=Streptomyces mirabilis TaxID=68239 RepID=UPI0036BCB2C8
MKTVAQETEKQDMGDVHEDPLAKLALRLRTLRAQRGLQMGGLQQRTGLGRTTVSQALNGQMVPSEATLVALAKALGADVEPMLALREAAVRISPVQDFAGEAVRGRPISDWDPLDLEVHPAVEVSAEAGTARFPDEYKSSDPKLEMPGYVRRPHDEELAALVASAAKGHSRMAVLVGSSSTGKTRACWEAVQPLAPLGWRLWHPFEPTHAKALLADHARIGPRTVVWINDAQHYLGTEVGEHVASALRALLTDATRGPVLILGTLWPEYAATYTVLPSPGQADPHAQVRALLARRRINVPDCFDTVATAATKTLAAAGDRQLAQALKQVRDGRLAQYLAGAPELVHRYETATPPARALLHAAMDARRLGASLHLPLAFLEHAAADYLADDEYDTLTDDWFEQALADTSRPVHGHLAPLRRIRPRRSTPATSSPQQAYRLADYLEERGRAIRRILCPPLSFWEAAHQYLTHAEDLNVLADAAEHRHRTYWAYQLRDKAAEAGHPQALYKLAEWWQAEGDRDEAERLAALAAEAGHSQALYMLAFFRSEEGDREEAERLADLGAKAGDSQGLYALAGAWREGGHWGSAARLVALACFAGDAAALYMQAMERWEQGDREEAERLADLAAETGDPQPSYTLAMLRREEGNWDAAERLAQKAAGAGQPRALVRLAELRWEQGERDEAERLAVLAADAGDTEVLTWLAGKWTQAGDRKQTERLTQMSADAGHPAAMYPLAMLRWEEGNRDEAERLADAAANAGHPEVLTRLAVKWKHAGGQEQAERLTQKAVDAACRVGDISTILILVTMAANDPEQAERLARQAVDAGIRSAGDDVEHLWPHGLDPDGTPSEPW